MSFLNLLLAAYCLLLTGYWLRDAPTSLTFNTCALCPRCVNLFCIYLTTNSDLCYLHHKLISFYNRDEKCLLRGTNWVFKWSSLRFICKGLKVFILIFPQVLKTFSWFLKPKCSLLVSFCLGLLQCGECENLMERVLSPGACLYYLSPESFVLEKVQIEIIRLQTLITHNLRF
jgi:hypothetical protein